MRHAFQMSSARLLGPGSIGDSSVLRGHGDSSDGSGFTAGHRAETSAGAAQGGHGEDYRIKALIIPELREIEADRLRGSPSPAGLDRGPTSQARPRLDRIPVRHGPRTSAPSDGEAGSPRRCRRTPAARRPSFRRRSGSDEARRCRDVPESPATDTPRSARRAARGLCRRSGCRRRGRTGCRNQSGNQELIGNAASVRGAGSLAESFVRRKDGCPARMLARRCDLSHMAKRGDMGRQVGPAAIERSFDRPNRDRTSGHP